MLWVAGWERQETVSDGSCLWDFLGSGAEKEAASVSGVCAGVELEKNEGDEARGNREGPECRGGETRLRVLSKEECGWLGILEGPPGCCVENVLEMGSHKEGNQLGELKLPRVKTRRL